MHIFKGNLEFRIILDLQNTCEDGTELLYTPHLVHPNINLFPYGGAFVKMKKNNIDAWLLTKHQFSY